MIIVCDLAAEEQFNGPSGLDWDSLEIVFVATRNDDDRPSS